jgi:hypothetical protein
MALSTIAIRVIKIGVFAAGITSVATFTLPMATSDERSVLTKVARNEPVTTCLALKTVKPEGYWISWADKPRGTELARARKLSRYRDTTLTLDAESMIDNSLKLECKDRTSLSTPSFYGNLAFVELKARNIRETVVLNKTGDEWNFLTHHAEIIQLSIID